MRNVLWFTLAAAAAAAGALAWAAVAAPLQVLDALQPARGVEIEAGVPYGTHPRQQIDLFRPAGPAPAAGHPVAVFVYGGSWNRGSRADYRFVGKALAGQGFLTAVLDYRLYPEVRYPDFVDDTARAVAWVLREAARRGGDPSRVYLVGHSAGAYNAAMLALDPRWLQAHGQSPTALAGWVGLAGPYDFYPMSNPDAQPVFFHPNYPPRSQPIDFATASAPRTLLLAAREDPLVDPQRNSRQLAAKLTAAGVPVKLELYDRVGHATLIASFAWPLRWLAPALDKTVAFMRAPPR